MKVRAHRIEYGHVIDEMLNEEPPEQEDPYGEYKAGDDYYGHEFHCVPPPPQGQCALSYDRHT